MRILIEYSAQVIEMFAVAIIMIAIVHGTIRYLIRVNQQMSDAYQRLKAQLGKALLLGLEFLVAADIVRTVALEPNLQNVVILGLLVIIRTFLSWSLVVEIEGHWPGEVPGGEEQRVSSDGGRVSKPLCRTCLVLNPRRSAFRGEPHGSLKNHF
jgi:uncharacterized membrane protein